MISSTDTEFCQEAYEVEKTIEVVVAIAGQTQRIRIEALRSISGGHYCTRASIESCVTVQPTFPQTNRTFDNKPEDVTIWAHYDLPWVNRQSADDALKQALGWLKERCST
jgi:hypothetical protein